MPIASAAPTSAIIEIRIRILLLLFPALRRMPSCSVEFPAMQPLDRVRGKPRVVAIVAAAGLFSSLYAQTGSQGTWSSKASLPMPRTEVGAAFAGGKLYVVAGG